MSIYDSLNEEQKKGVFTTEGPVLLLAGAGSGNSGAGEEAQEERKEGKGHHLYPGTGGEDGAGCQAAGIREGSVHPSHRRV